MGHCRSVLAQITGWCTFIVTHELLYQPDVYNTFGPPQWQIAIYSCLSMTIVLEVIPPVGCVLFLPQDENNGDNTVTTYIADENQTLAARNFKTQSGDSLEILFETFTTIPFKTLYMQCKVNMLLKTCTIALIINSQVRTRSTCKEAFILSKAYLYHFICTSSQ